MRTAAEVQRLAEQFWVDEAFTDRDAMQPYRHAMVKEIHHLCQAWDFEGMEDWLAVYRCAEPRCREEPLATVYEHGLMLITFSIASSHAAMGSFDTMYVLAEQILELLRVQEERRAKLGLMELGNSEIKYHVYSTLAQAKWQGPASERDRLMSVEDTAAAYRRAADRALNYLAGRPDEDPSRVLEALALDGVDVAAMLFRWFQETEPEKVAEFIEWHNSRSSAQLALEVGHCLAHEPLVVNSNYWTYELAKLHLTGRLTKEILEYCHAQRLATVLDTLNAPRPVGGMHGAWERDKAMMLAAISEIDKV